MKNISANLEEFRTAFNELHSSHHPSKDTVSVVFKAYRLSLVDSSSQQIVDILGEAQHQDKNRPVVLVQQDDHPRPKIDGLIDEFTDESLDDTDRSHDGRDDHRQRDQEVNPLTVDDARYLLSLHNLCNNPNLTAVDSTTYKTLPDMYVLCDGRDSEHIAVMGCLSKPGSSKVKGQRSAEFSVTTVSCFGPVDSKSHLLSVDQVIQQNGGPSRKENVTTTAFAQYEIVGMLTDHEMSVLEPIGPNQHTSVTMDCTWENVKGMLEKPHSAKCNVHVCAVPGDMRSAAYSVYRELATLVGFMEALDTEELNWNTTESTGESVKEAVIRLMEREKEGPQRKPEEKIPTPLESGDCDLDSLLRHYVIPERQDLYFSERLWTILWSRAICYDDVVNAFLLVFSELRKGELQPIVHGDNHSTLAKVIRASYQQGMQMVSADEVATLTVLVEIGLDKLRRDYTNFFIASELTTLNQLQWYVQTSAMCSLREQMSRLQALHNVLEVAVVSVTSLKLPPEHRRVLVRSALSYYQTNSHDDLHTFSHPVEATTVQSLYTSFQPFLWRLNVKGSSGTSSSYQLSVKQPMPHTTGLDPDLSIGDLSCSDSFGYFVSHRKESTVSFL